MRLSALVFIIIFNTLIGSPARAQQDPNNLPPLDAALMADGAPIKMTPDGPAVVRLDQDAASVIIGNPAHATAILENPRLIMLMPQQPGATQIMALDHNGKSILNRHVLVGGGKSQFIRINRACGTAQNAACQPVSMYYCPDRCYETAVAQGPAGSSGAAAVAPAYAGGDDSGVGGVPAQEIPETIGENPVAVE